MTRTNSQTFTAEFFRGNRERLKKLFTGTAPIVLTAHGLQQWSTDCAYPFKQDGSFWYLTGIEQPNIVLVMDKGREYLIIPKLTASREAFDGAIDIAHLTSLSGIEEVLYEKEGWKRLEARLKRVNTVAVLSPAQAYVDVLGMYTNPARRRLMNRIKQINSEVEFLDLRQHLQRMRMIKQPLEIEAITQAVNITVQSLKQLHSRFQKGRYSHEFDAEIDLSHEFYKRGATGHGFPPIIAAGGKGSILHASGNKDPILSNQQLLVDVGAEYDHYTADITRTWHTKPTKRFKAIYQSVLEVTDYACSLLKPGVILREYENQVEKFMGEKLRSLGLIKVIDHDSVRRYFPSLTSHFLGIDVHDVGDYEQPLQPGAVLTVEPGIYVPAEGIGVRIEDDVLINNTGCTVLSASLKK